MTTTTRVDGVDPSGLPGRLRAAAWVLPLALFIATFAVYAVTAERSHIFNDAYAASVGSWRIASTGEPWLDGVAIQDPRSPDSFGLDWYWLGEAPNGHIVAHRMAGPIVAGVPFYWLLGGGSASADFNLLAGGVAASMFAALAVLFLYLAIRRRLPDPVALGATLIFAFATPTWSVSANGLLTHPVTQFGIAGAALGLSRDRWWLAGVFLGVGMWGRPHVAVIAAVVGIGLALSRRDLRPVLGLAIPTLSSLGLLMIWNRWYFGEWSIGGAYGDSRITQAAEGLAGSASAQWTNYLGFLVSADRGFLVWSPIVLLMVPAVIRSWRSVPAWTKWLAVGGVVYTIFQLRLNYFAGGDGFYGYRHGLELLTTLAPLLAFSSVRVGGAARLLTPPLVALQLAAITLGAAVSGFFVRIENVWRDNSFWLALRDQPVAVGPWLILCLSLGVFATIRVNRGPRPVDAKGMPPVPNASD